MPAMAAAQNQTLPKIRVFRNGDRNFCGQQIVLNPRHVRDYEALLQTITSRINLIEAARSIRTPFTGRPIQALEELRDGCDYVAVGNGKFKKIEYLNLESNQIRQRQTRNVVQVEKVKHHRKGAGRIHREKTAIVIKVFSNGETLKTAKRVVLTQQMLESWDRILTEVNRFVHPEHGATRMLYTMRGDLVKHRVELQRGGYYVASSAFARFKDVEYGGEKPLFFASPHITRSDIQNESPREVAFAKFTTLSVDDDEDSRATSSYILSAQSLPLQHHSYTPPRPRRLSPLHLYSADGKPVPTPSKPIRHKRRKAQSDPFVMVNNHAVGAFEYETFQEPRTNGNPTQTDILDLTGYQNNDCIIEEPEETNEEDERVRLGQTESERAESDPTQSGREVHSRNGTVGILSAE